MKKKFDELLRGFDLNYFGTGKHKITFEKMMELKREDKIFILDVRTKEENECVKFNFAKNIPISEIPDRMHELPKDKMIAVFCSSSTRAVIVSTYLQCNGYEDVKILLDNIEKIAEYFKPGYVLNNFNDLIEADMVRSTK